MTACRRKASVRDSGIVNRQTQGRGGIHPKDAVAISRRALSDPLGYLRRFSARIGGGRGYFNRCQ